MEDGCMAHVIVIGAGIAGLSAAVNLTKCLPDCKVTILEALTRPGGRVHSIQITDNAYLEEGATFLHSIEKNPIKELFTRHTLLTDDDDSDANTKTKYCTTNGDEVSSKQFEFFQRLFEKLIYKAMSIYHKKTTIKNGIKSVGGFLQKEFLLELQKLTLTMDDERTASSILRMLSLEECCTCGCSSLYDLLLDDYGEYDGARDGDLMVKGGYSQVVDELLKKLPENCVAYNSPVTEIQWKNVLKGSPKPVSVVCENGNQYYADHIITTQSLGHLKENARTMFRPALPQVKLDIIDRMGFNYVTKIHLRYKTPFWQDTFTSFTLLWDGVPEDAVNKINDFTKETWYKKIFEFTVHPLVSNTLEVWLSGESALHAETLEDDDISKTCTDLLRSFLKDPTIPEPDEVLKTSWNTNPYFRGAYSYVAVGSSGEDIDGLAEPLCVENSEGVNIPRILFAGEATHRTYYSTTHGALLSGEREARRLINLYQCSSHK